MPDSGLTLVTEEFLRKGNNKDLPNRTVARMLFEKYPNLFKGIEQARNVIRYARGAYGQGKAKREERKDLIRTPEQIESWKKRFPKPDDEGFKWHDLPSNISKWLFLYDVHVPFFDRDALMGAIKEGKRRGVDGVFLGGDFSDCYQGSDFVKDPRIRSYPSEVEMVKDIHSMINEILRPKAFFWKLGNHEARIERLVMSKAPALVGLKGLSYEEIYQVKESGITLIPPTHPARYKALTILHGDEYGGILSPVNPARGLYLKAGACTVGGHLHATSEHTASTVQGKIVTCWSVGCLSNLHPKYAPLNKWNHGFGMLEVSQTGGMWKFQNKRIVEGEVV